MYRLGKIRRSKTPTALSKDCEGVALMEAIFVIPVLLAVGLGVFEFGYFFYQRHLVEAGVRDAARYIASFPENAANGPDIVDAQNIAIYGSIYNTTTPRLNWWTSTSTVDIQYSDDPVASLTFDGGTISLRNSFEKTTGDWRVMKVVVTARVPYRSLGFLTSFFGLQQITHTVRHEERLIGNR